jgi:hypothetical protein
MSEEQTADEVLKLVEKAQSKGVFNITDFAKGRGYPEDSVTTYIDVESAYELSKINKKIANSFDDDEINELDKVAKELAAKVSASKVVFHMRGINEGTIDGISDVCNKKYPVTTNVLGQVEQDPNWNRDFTAGLVAANLIKIEDADGNFDERVFSIDDVNELRDYLPREAWSLIVEKMQQLTLAGTYFEGLTDAGFLQKS